VEKIEIFLSAGNPASHYYFADWKVALVNDARDVASIVNKEKERVLAAEKGKQPWVTAVVLSCIDPVATGSIREELVRIIEKDKDILPPCFYD
jgi:hypothetical protein